MDQRQDNQGGDGVRDECRDDEDEETESGEDGIEGEVFHTGGDSLGNGIEEARGGDCFP